MPEQTSIDKHLEDIIADMSEQFERGKTVPPASVIPAQFQQFLAEVATLYRQNEFTDDQKQRIASRMSEFLETLKYEIDCAQKQIPYIVKELEVYNATHTDSQIAESNLLHIASNICLKSVTNQQLEKLVPKMVERIFADADEVQQSGAISNIIEILKKAAASFQKDHVTASVGAKVPESIAYPLEKAATTLFSGMQIGRIPLKAEPNGKSEVTNYITLDVDELPEDNSVRAVWSGLSIFDKRVYISIDALLRAGNEYMSASQIWRAMGNDKAPSQDQIKRILESCEKMSKCRISFDNSEEVKAGYHYDAISIKRAYLLPMEMKVDIAINGKIVKNCIQIIRPSLPIMEIARSKRQCIPYTHEQLAIPLSMTDDNLKLDDYLRRRIARNEANRKIMRQTVYDNCGISKSDRKKRARFDEKMRKLFARYKEVGILADYKEQPDCFIIDRAKN
jgi:hypothetical protein